MSPANWPRRLGAAVLVVTAVSAGAARANCVDSIIELSWIQPAMERYWSQLAHAKTHPWGNAQVLGRISGKKCFVTREFDTLTGAQKLEVLGSLRLGYAEWTPGLLAAELTAAERARLPHHSDVYLGAMSPYEVYTDDGILVSAPYDGCTRDVALTERARYSVYFNRPRPRSARFPLAAANEKDVKARFWRYVGYRNAGDYWIGWVPERGYFEVDVPDSSDRWFLEVLKPFWASAPTAYHYVVYANDGTRLYEHVAGKPDAPRDYSPPADDAPRHGTSWHSAD